MPFSFPASSLPPSIHDYLAYKVKVMELVGKYLITNFSSATGLKKSVLFHNFAT